MFHGFDRDCSNGFPVHIVAFVELENGLVVSANRDDVRFTDGGCFDHITWSE